MGTKRHVLVDGRGVPLSIVVTGANRHDVTQLAAVLDGRVVRPARRVRDHLCAPRDGRARLRPPRALQGRGEEVREARRKGPPVGGGGVPLVDEPVPQAAGEVREDGRVLHGAVVSCGGENRLQKGKSYLGIGSKYTFSIFRNIVIVCVYQLPIDIVTYTRKAQQKTFKSRKVPFAQYARYIFHKEKFRSLCFKNSNVIKE